MDFKERYNNFLEFLQNKRTYIHCETEDEANLLLSKLHEMGIPWRSGSPLTCYNFYEMYKKETVYCIQESCFSTTKKDTVSYANTGWAIMHGYKVFEFKDIVMDLQELNAEMLLNGEL